jgi:hypothetical protein
VADTTAEAVMAVATESSLAAMAVGWDLAAGVEAWMAVGTAVVLLEAAETGTGLEVAGVGLGAHSTGWQEERPAAAAAGRATSSASAAD